MPIFKPDAKVYRVRINVEVVARDGQGARDGARSSWENGGDVGDVVELLEGREPKSWMAYDDGAVVRGAE